MQRFRENNVQLVLRKIKLNREKVCLEWNKKFIKIREKWPAISTDFVQEIKPQFVDKKKYFDSVALL